MAQRHTRDDRRTDATSNQLHELAEVERLLREDARATDPLVHIGRDGARISWASWGLNAHARGSLTASVCSEIALSSSWGLSTVHDPHETDDGTFSMLTLIYDPDKTEDRA